MSAELHLYSDLADWWPLISAPAEYAEEAGFAATLLNTAQIEVNDVLELGSGGGNNASHLGARFTMTLVDASPAMLEVSRRLNPGCEHHVGDMRDVRLGRAFDAVFVHDAVGYLVTEADLRKLAETAFFHCRPGGVAVFLPDCTLETFAPGTEHGGVDDDTGRGARYLAWIWDPDPGDTWYRAEYAYVLREADGTTRHAHDAHVLGMFTRAVWLDVLAGAGFEPEAAVEVTTDERPPRDVFVAHRPMR